MKGVDSMKQSDVYKEIRVFEFPNMTVRVHFPDLTEEERAIRMKELRNAVINIFKK